MREILFRGRTENGFWYEGDLIHDKTGIFIAYLTEKGNYGEAQIKPETIGQYTGLNDKNGKRIFEGDICRWVDTDGQEHIFSVEFKSGCFMINDKETLYEVLPLDVEVIGNIHDDKAVQNE